MTFARRSVSPVNDDGDNPSGKRFCAASIHEQVARCLAAAMFGVADEHADEQAQTSAMPALTEQFPTPWRYKASWETTFFGNRNSFFVWDLIIAKLSIHLFDLAGSAPAASTQKGRCQPTYWSKWRDCVHAILIYWMWARSFSWRMQSQGCSSFWCAIASISADWPQCK